MAACGLWRSRHRLVAVVVDGDGRIESTIRTAADDEERWALLQYVDSVHGLDCPLVLPDDMLRVDALCHFALERGHDLWAAPRPLIEAIRHVAHLATDGRVAAMIARLPTVAALRGHLRRIDRAAYDRRQLSLL